MSERGRKEFLRATEAHGGGAEPIATGVVHIAEIDALRKELAETKTQLGSARKQLETIWAVVSGLNPVREA